MAILLAEGLVNALNTYLTANLSAKLTALNTEYADGITLEAPISTYVGLKSLKSIPHYPAMYILSPTSRFNAWTNRNGESKPEVSVGMLAIDQDSEVLQRRLYRYGRAFLELMLDGTTSMDGWVMATDEDWEIDTIASLRTDSATSDFVGEATLSMRCLKIEFM